MPVLYRSQFIAHGISWHEISRFWVRRQPIFGNVLLCTRDFPWRWPWVL